MDKIFSFFIENFPSLKSICLGGPAGMIWAWACLSFSGYLKVKKGLRTGYSRKTFHFLIFSSVALIQWIWGTKIVCLFGGMTSIVIFYAILRGDGHPMYEAMAREKDAPKKTHYIVVPFFATLIGGLASNIFFGPVAVIGYLVTGMGDAVGEPIGVRFGKHTYKVPSLTKVKAIRSYEGSAAVFLMSVVAIICGMALNPNLGFNGLSLVLVPALGLACALTEAVSPHGWDNASMQVIPSWLAFVIL